MTRLLTLKQAAEYLHLHPETVRQRAKCGEIPASFQTGRWLFIDADLLEYIRAGYHTGDQTQCRASTSAATATIKDSLTTAP